MFSISVIKLSLAITHMLEIFDSLDRSLQSFQELVKPKLYIRNVHTKIHQRQNVRGTFCFLILVHISNYDLWTIKSKSEHGPQILFSVCTLFKGDNFCRGIDILCVHIVGILQPTYSKLYRLFCVSSVLSKSTRQKLVHETRWSAISSLLAPIRDTKLKQE